MTGITLPATPEMVATLMILHVRQTGHHWSHATEGLGFICRYCAQEMQLPDQPSNLEGGQSLTEAFKTFKGCEQILAFVNGEAAKGFVPNIWHRILGGESV